MNRVLIRGDGVAARCSAHLLARAGFRVSLEASRRTPVPAILLSEPAQRLLRDIFELPDLFRELPRIARRVVAWGPEAAPAELDHSAVVVSETDLLASLPAPENKADAEPDWTVYAAPPLPRRTEQPTEQHRFGSRMASLAPADAEPGACWIESLDEGWLFLIPGWLIAVGAPADQLLAKSRVVKRHISRCDPATLQFPASPRMAAPLSGNGPLGGDRWIACGGAAMAFDPICGDGTAHAVREAILASAVIRAAEYNDAAPLIAHYQARLTAGFARHLATCRPFYTSGGNGEWWRAEALAIGRGLEWCGAKLAEHGGFRYRLSGLELEPVP